MIVNFLILYYGVSKRSSFEKLSVFDASTAMIYAEALVSTKKS